MGMEYELKFKATPPVQQEILGRYPGKTVEFSMETTYYDTPSGALSARRFTLRRRMENGLSVCTLKTPGKGQERGEWELPCDRIQDALSGLCALGAPEELLTLAEEGLVPICGARFHRTAITLTRPEGTIELALDQGVLTGGGREIPLCEVEAELKDGPISFADAFGQSLAREFGLTPEPDSKFRRALALYKGE